MSRLRTLYKNKHTTILAQPLISHMTQTKNIALFVASTYSGGVQLTAILWYTVASSSLRDSHMSSVRVYTTSRVCSFSVSCPTTRSAAIHQYQRTQDVSPNGMLPTSCRRRWLKTNVASCGSKTPVPVPLWPLWKRGWKMRRREMKCLQVRDVTENFVFLRYGTHCC
jgi:hypothetical protein